MKSSTPAVVASAMTLAMVAAAQQRPVFRSTSELILVDVHVVDRSGNPVLGLTPSDFEVSIDRRKRTVVSAELIQYDPGRPRADRTTEEPVPRSDGGPSAEGRTFILAVDEASFQAKNALAAMQAVRRFIERLNPTDRVALFPFPVYASEFIATTDHESVLARLQTIVGTLGDAIWGQSLPVVHRGDRHHRG